MVGCSTHACGSEMSAASFQSVFGPFAKWASGALNIPYALILTQWFHESGKGKADICTPYNNPANYDVSGPHHPFNDICNGTSSGYILPMKGSGFKVNASDANGRTAAKYIYDAWKNGYTIPSSNKYGSIPGAGTKLAAGFQAATAAMGAMGWAESNYYTSGNTPKIAGNILNNWYKLYFSDISTSTIGANTVPSCCGWVEA